jgi:hypothetical protein
LNAFRKKSHVIVGPTHDSIHHRDQSEKRNEHDGNVEGELPAIDGAARDSTQNVGILVHLLLGDFHGARGLGLLRFRHQHLGHQDCARRGHDHGSEQIFRFDAVADVSRHNPARNMRHAGGHDRHQFGFCAVRKKRSDGERRFSLSHENGSRHV